MSRRVIEIIKGDVSDRNLSGVEGVHQEVPFMFNGVEVKLDLEDEFFRAFEALAPKGKDPAPDGSLLREAVAALVVPSRTRTSSERSTRTAAIRAWAATQTKEDGTPMFDIKDRGAIPQNIEEAYDKAMAAASSKK